MFGSRYEATLMGPPYTDAREIIWRSSRSDGVLLRDVVSELTALMARPDAEALMIGYWEYGDEIVVTAPTVTT